ncbi:hypothetical protein C3Y98_00855 [Methylotenera oryzisoli]|uniref:Uncharacterized protein n=1 Tax=Methylotenera oryzisoli TaxID=2080758 RepID=A0A4Y9VW53_9PROT|nr:hypothetical protein [Methylotenera oryzisoli]TFW70755.1 hypothetical protein C3Y98_08755 [Methylotenera oryzisoli]TFW73461.1 hypothetical protein C3Y98_00855 [Methylotenera oryzisoli]
MFKYQDGSEILIGDSVMFENGKTIGIVELIAVSEADIKSINVNEAGIMLKSEPFGLVYLSEHWLKNDPLLFLSHAPA